MLPKPAACVVVPCHDAAATLGLQLQALADQRDAPSFEVVVVDNRSADDVASTVAAYTGRLDLRLVAAHELAGAGYARNVGVRAARADILLFCDADDLVARDWVAAGVDALAATDAACGVDVTLPPVEFDSVDRLWREHLDPMPRGAVIVPTTAKPYPIVLGGNLAVRRSAYTAVGGYDASMTFGNEDNDLAVRLERAGFLIARAPAMRLAIRERGDLRSLFRRARNAGRGHQQLCVRHDLRSSSPHLRGGAWRADLPRTAFAAARMLTRPAADRDWPAIATRFGAAQGLWEGEVLTRLHRFPTADPARGLFDDETAS